MPKWQSLKLRCDSRFQHAFAACSCVFKVITLVWANQRNYFENATTCSKRMRKTLVATQLKEHYVHFWKRFGENFLSSHLIFFLYIPYHIKREIMFFMQSQIVRCSGTFFNMWDQDRMISLPFKRHTFFGKMMIKTLRSVRYFRQSH